MTLVALVEIVRNEDGSLPTTLIRSLYLSSCRGVFGLALRDVHWTEIDAELDDLVRSFPLTIPGVKYIDADDGPALRAAAAEADTIVASTEAFLRTLRGGAERVTGATFGAVSKSACAASAAPNSSYPVKISRARKFPRTASQSVVIAEPTK